MKKLALLTLIVLFIQSTASSQPCLPDGIEFTTQEQIDNFQTNYPNCTEIEGYMIIYGNDITNLSGLNVVTSIGGFLRIGFRDYGNPNLTSLAGLESLTYIGGDLLIYGNLALTSLTGLDNLSIINGNLYFGTSGMMGVSVGNPLLASLTGLANLTSIGGDLSIWNTVVLASLNGMEGLTSIGGDLAIEGNAALTSLTGLEGLTSIEENLYIGGWYGGNSTLTSLAGLENVVSIGGDLIIWYNDALISVAGLNSVTFIGGDLDIRSNADLLSLTGLENITFIEGNIIIGYVYNSYHAGNPSLTSLTGLGNLASIGGYLSIQDNDVLTNLSGFDNLMSIGGDLRITTNDTLGNFSGMENLTSIGGGLSIANNAAITSMYGLNNMTSIGGDISIVANDALTSLIGLDNIGANSITDLYIINNGLLSTCEAQWLCDYLSNPNGSVNIYNNAPGCNNPPEIANTCGIILPCLPVGNYHFFTQTQIDNFPTNYPNCTILEGDVYISGDDITNLNGLNVVTSTGGDLYVRNNNFLTNLTGLDNMTSIGGGFSMHGNHALTSLAGLDSLTSMGGDLYVSNNNVLINLTGLDNVTSIGGDLSIKYNNVLSTCEVQSICNYLDNPNGAIQIQYNAPGCNSQEEVEEACDALTGVVINEAENYSIYPNPVKDILAFSSEEITSVEIYDLMGVLITRRMANKVDMSHLSPGIYFVIGFDKHNHALYKGKIIKK